MNTESICKITLSNYLKVSPRQYIILTKIFKGITYVFRKYVRDGQNNMNPVYMVAHLINNNSNNESSV